MKNLILFLFLIFVGNVMYAQVNEITIERETTHFIGRNLYVDSNKCYLLVSSDNQFESKLVKIYLGNRYDSVIKSLNNIITAIKEGSKYPNGSFTISSYKFKCYCCEYMGYYAYIYGTPLSYTAGSYEITVTELEKCKQAIKDWIDGKYYGNPQSYNEVW